MGLGLLVPGGAGLGLGPGVGPGPGPAVAGPASGPRATPAARSAASAVSRASASASVAAVPPGGSSSPSSTVVGVRWSAVPGHLDPQLPSVQQRSVHGVHRVLGVPFVVETNERKASALFRVAVSGDVYVAHPAVLLEHPAEGFGRCSVRKVVHFQRSHAVDVRRRPTVTHGGESCEAWTEPPHNSLETSDKDKLLMFKKSTQT